MRVTGTFLAAEQAAKNIGKCATVLTNHLMKEIAGQNFRFYVAMFSKSLNSIFLGSGCIIRNFESYCLDCKVYVRFFVMVFQVRAMFSGFQIQDVLDRMDLKCRYCIVFCPFYTVSQIWFQDRSWEAMGRYGCTEKLNCLEVLLWPRFWYVLSHSFFVFERSRSVYQLNIPIDLFTIYLMIRYNILGD